MLLENLRVQLARLDAPEEDLDILRRSMHQLEELFLIVVVGEFNAGKTAFLRSGKLMIGGTDSESENMTIQTQGLRSQVGVI